MAKQEIAVSTHSEEEMTKILSEYEFALPLASHKRLFGGYSGSNYRVEAADGAGAPLTHET